MKRLFSLFLSYCFVITILSCKQQKPSVDLAENNVTSIEKLEDSKTFKEPSQQLKDYWYKRQAEITSYKLEQARYGEMRDGEAVLIYVTEDFLPNIQVKADRQNNTNIPVLKLNATKNFNTGIYPYSIMQSVFFPVNNIQNALKVSSSIQEWCGQAYTQLNNRAQFEIMSHSYFEGEADENLKLDKAILENELWTKLRIDPKGLPTGNLEIIPALEFIRLKHVPIKAYKATVELKDDNYTITYPDLNRTLSINFNTAFPFEILSWEESFKSGYGPNAKIMTTKATKLESIQSAYWGKNSNADLDLRKTLGLKQ